MARRATGPWLQRAIRRRAPAGILFMVLVTLAVLVYWFNPAGNPTIDMMALVAIGFLIYGPVMLIGLYALELAPKKAAGTAAGFTGLFGYLGGAVAANAMLGYTYFTDGVVEPGRQLGRTIGFPTLNLAWAPELPPRYGVYVVEVSAGGARPLKGVANYGLRPTVTETRQPLLEVHLLEASPLTYGDRLTVSWLHFLRPESKFGSLDALRGQIENDRRQALDFFAKNPVG